MKPLKNRVAVVTGAAGGIGRAVSVALAREGCDLAISDVNEAGLAATASQVRALGRRAVGHVVDVSDNGRAVAELVLRDQVRAARLLEPRFFYGHAP